MNQITNNAPCSQEHVKNCDQHRYARRIAYRKQRRVNSDVVRSICKCDRRNIERSRICAFYVIGTLGKQLSYSDCYRGDTKQPKPFMRQNLSTKKTD